MARPRIITKINAKYDERAKRAAAIRKELSNSYDNKSDQLWAEFTKFYQRQTPQVCTSNQEY